MSAPMLTRPERRVPAAAGAAVNDTRNDALARHAGRVRRLKANAVAWAFGSAVVTAAWIAHEWTANGAFERFAHEGNQGDWNPTLWGLVILVWAFVVGIMALGVHFERAAVRRERSARLKFHAAAWLLGMILLAPLNVLIEWQDNGGFERISGNSRPGSWDPWILYVGGIWALVVVTVVALPLYLGRRKTGA